MALKLKQFKSDIFFINKENRVFLITQLIISSKSPIYKIIGFRILLISILRNYKFRKSSSFYSNIIITIPLFPFTTSVVDKALGKIYFKTIQYLL